MARYRYYEFTRGQAALLTCGAAILGFLAGGFSVYFTRAEVITDSPRSITTPQAPTVVAQQRTGSSPRPESNTKESGTAGLRDIPTTSPLSANAGAALAGHLIVPVQSVQPQQLVDNFHQVRDGHQHEALDIMAPMGTPVLAAGDGVIKKFFTSKLGGLTIYQFDPSAKYCYYYAHLSRYAPTAKEGATVHQGDVIAYVGMTGDAPVPHLHFAISVLGPEKKWWKGEAIDPFPILRAPANSNK